MNNGHHVNDPNVIAEDFCNYFTNVGVTFASAIPPSKKSFDFYLNNNMNANSIYFSPTDPEEIEKILTAMKPKNSRGIDDLSTNFLRKIKESIKDPLSKLINTSLEKGQVPTILKTAKVIPIFKNKNR